MKLLKFILPVLGIAIAMVCVRPNMAASESIIRGTVTDSNGKPIRAAMVKAQSGYKIVTRYSQNDGKYEIAVPAGDYSVNVDAFGFTSRREDKVTASAGDTNFKLSPRIDVTHLTGAEVLGLLPENDDTRLIRAECLGCHSFARYTMKRGSTAADWREFLPGMTGGRLPVAVDPGQNPNASELRFTALTNALGKYFGPDAPFFGNDAVPPTREQVNHVEPPDATLRATIYEYVIPTSMPMAHSMSIDPARRIAWWGEESHMANKVGRFNMDTETFVEYPVQTPDATVHTGLVGKDGRYWVTLLSGRDSKIASVEPATGKLTEYKWPEKKGNPHTMTLDKAGNIVMSGGASGEIWTFDTETEKFGFHTFPVPTAYPADSLTIWDQVPGEKMPPVRASSYDIKVNSKGVYYFTLYNMGTLMSLDPVTGESKTYHPAATPSMRGLTIDPQDNVWFSDYDGHMIGKLDAKTGTIKEYQPPTHFAAPYGLVVDKQGYVWFSDLMGDNLTRFDPKTEKFVEYPLPTRDSGPKFMDLDGQGRLWFTEVMGSKIGMIETGDAGKQTASAH